jgi:hypothetical protein
MSINDALNGLNPLAYVGVNSPNPAAQVITKQTDPTVNDSQNFSIGDIWINQNTQTLPNHTESIWILVSLNGSAATWAEIGQEGQVLNVIGGSNITVNTVANTATVNLNPSVALTGSLTTGGDIITTAGSIQASSGSLFATNVSNTGISSLLSFTKNRSGGAVHSGDVLGFIEFNGFDGTTNQSSAQILVATTGTIGAGRVPSIMSFNTTPDAVSGDLTRVVIDQNGMVTINAVSAGIYGLTVTDPINGLAAILAGAEVIAGTTLVTSGDTAGVAGSTSFSNVNVANVPGGGTLSINSQSANPGAQAGFIKIYVGTTVAYIPYFTDISP